MQSNNSLFECKCDLSLYWGTYCENRNDLCSNHTCSGNGQCRMNRTNAHVCTCFIGYSGQTCDIELISIKIVRGVRIGSVIIAVICICLTIFLIVSNDACNIFLARQRRKLQKNSKIKRKVFKKRISKN